MRPKEMLTKLADGFSRQYELYRQMLGLSKEQYELRDNMDEIYRILLEKQKLVLQIQNIDKEISESKKWWAENKNLLSREDRRQVETWFEKIENILKQLLDLENQVSSSVKDKMKEVEEKLSEVSVGKRAVRAYGNALKRKGQNEPRFMDKQR